MTKKLKPVARLENWKTVYAGEDKDGNPITVLRGIVYGHRYLPDGERIVTSKILTLSNLWGTCETLNTVYALGAEER